MTSLATHVSAFFATYLPKAKGASPHTMRAYRDAIAQFISFAAETAGKDVESLEMHDVGREALEAFLEHLESERGASVPTRNHRLAAAHALFRYIQLRDMAWLETCNGVLAVEKKRCPAPLVGHIGIDGMRAVLAQPDPSTQSGLTHLALLSLLYESGARVQELIDVRTCDLSRGCGVVVLHGKGGKSRSVPIGKETAAVLERYIRVASPDTEGPLFPGRCGKMSRSGVRYLVEKYSSMARSEGAEVPSKVTPHTFRHSRAMHLLEAGVNLVYISDLLGHASVTTTEVYAKANPEMRRKAIEEHGARIAPPDAYSDDDKDDLLGWLKGMSW